MEFTVEEYIKTNLTPGAYFLLYSIITENITLKNHLTHTLFDTREEGIELQTQGYIKLMEEGKYQLRKKALDLQAQATPEIEFTTFWDEYHKVTGLKKTDLQAATKYWNKLSKKDKQLALDNIKPYYDSLPIYTTGKPVKKARTYLSAASYNDEFEVKVKSKSINEMI